MAASKCLSQRCGLDNPLVGELLVGRRYNAQPRRGLVSSRHSWGLCGKLRNRVLLSSSIGTITLGGLLLQSGLNNTTLLLSDIHALL